jgi:hypothetical protein
MATQDGAVTPGDIMKACREMNRRTPEQASAWMAEIEPLVVHYIEATASQIAGTLAMKTTKIEDVRRIALEVRKMGMVIMRSHQLGYHRLWENAFAPEPPTEGAK